jgi:hypothetical protein
VREDDRKAALTDLAKVEKKSELKILIDAIRALDGEKGSREESVVFDLVRMLTARPASDLATVRDDLEALASNATLPVTRQVGYVALIAADGSVDKAWNLGLRSPSALQDIVSAMPLIRDPEQRAALYPKVVPLLDGLPSSLADKLGKGKGTFGRYVRIELTAGTSPDAARPSNPARRTTVTPPRRSTA